MHKDDQMTPNERLNAYFSGNDIDRLPAMPFVSTLAGRFAGMTHREMRSTAKTQALAQIESYDQLGIDSMTIEYGLHGIGHACGSEWNDPEDSVPALVSRPMKTLDDLHVLDLEKVRRQNDPWFQLNYEACQICVEKRGQEVGTSVVVPGPFTAASSLFPIEKLLRETRRHPEKVHRLIRFCTDAAKLVMEEFIKIGGECFLCDPVASCSVISEKSYREFVLPYTTELVGFAHAMNSSVGYHICGNTTKITDAMLETGCDMLSVDTSVSLAFAKEKAGNKVPIIGNVDSNLVMMLGTVDDVYENIKQNLRDCYDSPQGYILSTGCDIPIVSPMENILAFMDGVRKFAKYPVRLENL